MQILQAALADVEAQLGDSTERLKATFDDVILQAEQIAYNKYLNAEAVYGGQILTAFLNELFGEDLSADLATMEREFRQHFHLLDKFFLSLAQGRKSRAGSAFEFFHHALFRKLGYPFEEQTLLSDSKPDFLMPSAAYYQQNPLHSIVFTAKRTLRERWRQITTEGTRGIGMYLATIDSKVTSQQLQHMVGHKIFLVVPEQIRRKAYPDATNVLSFARFFEDHLDPKLRIWKRDGVL
ncbi:MAG: type II restriction endonuclease [Planctomycetaceae bacterium]